MLARFVVFAVITFVAATTSAADLLIFSASWCGPCKQLKAALEKNPDIIAGYSVAYVDIDAEPEVARQYQVRTVPTLIIVEADASTRRKVGFTTVADLKRWLSGQEEPRKHRLLRR